MVESAAHIHACTLTLTHADYLSKSCFSMFLPCLFPVFWKLKATDVVPFLALPLVIRITRRCAAIVHHCYCKESSPQTFNIQDKIACTYTPASTKRKQKTTVQWEKERTRFKKFTFQCDVSITFTFTFQACKFKKALPKPIMF